MSGAPSPPALGRRKLLLFSAVFSATALGGMAISRRGASKSEPVRALGRDLGNFERVFTDRALRERFRPFLQNVFHLVPEPELTALISELVGEDPRDPIVYQKLLQRLPEVEPFLAGPRYALPALNHQKRVMAEQTAALLGPSRRLSGYFELGSQGRYFDALKDRFDFEGPFFTSAPREPTYSITDLVDRGQVGRVGTALPWTDYTPLDANHIPLASLDLITVYIGLHHALPEQRAPYIRWLHTLLRPGGHLILRDHDVTSPELFSIVSLAHDVFNAGTGESWATNESERRNFYPLGLMVDLFSSQGFVVSHERLLQDGDPTRNTLVCFRKV